VKFGKIGHGKRGLAAGRAQQIPRGLQGLQLPKPENDPREPVHPMGQARPAPLFCLPLVEVV